MPRWKVEREEGEPAWYVVQDADGRVPDEFYCYRHLIGEAEYLRKHKLGDSGSIWVGPQADGEDWAYEEADAEEGQCDFKRCKHYRRSHAS